jgi:tetratricopeptide (TPR) repeat protein
VNYLFYTGITALALLLSSFAIAEDNQARSSHTQHKLIDVPAGLLSKLNYTLPPYQPLISFGQRMPVDMEGRTQLTTAEEAIKSGKFDNARSLLTELDKVSPPVNLASCVRLADLEAMTGKMDMATRLAAGCFLRARNSGEPFKAVAALRVLAYGGKLRDVDAKTILEIKNSVRTIDPWIREEVLFETARFHQARQEYSEGYQNLIELFRINASMTYLNAVRPVVLEWLEQANGELMRQGHYASVAADILDALNYFMPLDDTQQARLALEGARSLRKAGAGALAADLLLWLLRKQAKHSDPATLQLLVEAFLDQRDSKRALRTLEYLQTTIPMAASTTPTLLLRGRVAEATKDTKTAIGHYQAAVKAATDAGATLEAAWRGALLLREGGKPVDALALLSVVMEKSVSLLDSQSQLADAIMLRADLAYELNRTEEARSAYRLFAIRFPNDPRVSIARYRLLRIDPEALSLAFKGTAVNDCWSAASDMIKQKLTQRRTSP